MPPKPIEVTYTDREANLIEPGANSGTRRFQWHPDNPKVTILDFSAEGTCELIRNVPMEHARYLWSKLIKKGWVRNV